MQRDTKDGDGSLSEHNSRASRTACSRRLACLGGLVTLSPAGRIAENIRAMNGQREK
jgi:hypothetical protein